MKKNRVMALRVSDLEKMGATKDPNAPDLLPIQKAFLDYFNAPYTAKTHTEIVLGNPDIGYIIKIICDSTGQIVVKDYDRVTCRERIPYPHCEFCGAPNKRWKDQIIDVQAELVIDTDWVDAFPAFPRYLDELDAA